MKKTLKTLLLALLVVCTVCVLTVMVGAEGETPATEGYVRLYESDKTTTAVHENDTNYLKWKVESVGTDKVLTIFLESKEGATKSETTLTFNTDPGWNPSEWNATKIPWFHHLSSVTKVVIEAPITAINQGYAFDMLKNVHTFVLPNTTIDVGSSNNSNNMMFANMNELTCFGPVGTAPNTLDFRTLTGSSSQGFENSCKGKTVTILCSYTGDFLPSASVVFADSTTLNIKALDGSPAHTTALQVADLAVTEVEKDGKLVDRSPYANVVNVKTYTDEELAGVNTEGVAAQGLAKWALDLGTKTVTVTPQKTGWAEFYVHDTAWQEFVAGWKNYIKTIEVDKFFKLTANGVSLINGGSDVLETVILEKNQRFNLGSSTGLFNGLTKLATVGFVDDITSYTVTEGVADLTGATGGFESGDESWNHNANWLKGMFNGCTSVTKVILPTSSYLTKIHATTFEGCTALTNVVIGENITTIEIEGGAFANWINSTEGYANLTVTFTEVTEAANALKALEGGRLTVIVPTADTTGLEKGISFDAWKVRISGYNGLRGVFYFDNTVTAENKANGWTLVEYGALLTTTAKKEAMGAVVYYDGTSSSVGGHVKYWPIFKDGKVSGKTLSNPVDVQKENATYFAVSITNYNNNYTTDVYMAGYEIWKNTEDEIVIKYTDYANDTYKNTSIYDVSMGMYMAGLINSAIDKEDIVWKTLVAGGALTLTAGTDYAKTHSQVAGGAENLKDLNGVEFGDTFTFADVTGVTQSISGTNLSFNETNLRISIFAHPEKAGKYVLVYGTADGTTVQLPGVETTAWDPAKRVHLQFSNTWFGTSYTVANALPNPVLTNSILGNIDYIVLDKGVTKTNGMCFFGIKATRLVYSDDLVEIAGTTFQSVGDALTTIFKAGTVPVEGRFDLHYIPMVNLGYTFNSCVCAKEIWLPENVGTSLGSETFKNCNSLDAIWCGDISNRQENVANFGNTGITSLGTNIFNYK